MTVSEAIGSWLTQRHCHFLRVSHAPTRTSLESAKARAFHDVPGHMGAKALVVRQAKTGHIITVVVPAEERANNSWVRLCVGKCSFATPEELALATGGLVPGSIPPLGFPLLPGIQRVYMSPALFDHDWLGFNAGCLSQSIVIPAKEFMAAVEWDSTSYVAAAFEKR